MRTLKRNEISDPTYFLKCVTIVLRMNKSFGNENKFSQIKILNEDGVVKCSYYHDCGLHKCVVTIFAPHYLSLKATKFLC